MSLLLRLGLALVLMVSALSLVSARYQARQLYMETERLVRQARELDLEWRRLQAERASLASNARVDRLARQELELIGGSPDRTLYLPAKVLSRGGAMPLKQGAQ